MLIAVAVIASVLIAVVLILRDAKKNPARDWHAEDEDVIDFVAAKADRR
jgi:hypothetical protein